MRRANEDVASVLFVRAHVEFRKLLKRFQREAHSLLRGQLVDAGQDRRKPLWRHSLFGEIMHLVILAVKHLPKASRQDESWKPLTT